MSHDIGLLGRAILRREANSARQRAAKLRTLHNIGTTIVSSEDVDKVLTRVVEAAVFITNAEEGSLLLLDEGTDELYLRAQKGLGEKYANGYRLRVEDSVAGEVLQAGLPQRMVSRSKDLKVVTGYMVNAIMYVPVCGRNGTVGVLSVDNQVAESTFTEDDEEFLLILAGYAALALENARRIEELERRSEEIAKKSGRRLPQPVEDASSEYVSVVLGHDHAPSPFQAPFSDRLLDVVNPYLGAVAEIQHCIDDLEDKPQSQVRVVAIAYGSPVVATVEGIRDAATVIGQTVAPKRRYLEDLAGRLLLAEKEAAVERARIEVFEARSRLAGNTNGDEQPNADVASEIAHLQRLELDRERLDAELQRNKIILACDLIAWVCPDLSTAETIHYVIRLLPALDQLLSSPLQLSMPQQQQQRNVQVAEEEGAALPQ